MRMAMIKALACGAIAAALLLPVDRAQATNLPLTPRFAILPEPVGYIDPPRQLYVCRNVWTGYSWRRPCGWVDFFHADYDGPPRRYWHRTHYRYRY